jgi:class 3 adenylate cyclase
VASRLCSFARENQVAISSATAVAAGAAVPSGAVAHAAVALKGKELPVDVVVYTSVERAVEVIDLVH